MPTKMLRSELQEMAHIYEKDFLMIIFYMGKKKTLLFKCFHGTKDGLNVRLMNE